MTLAGSHSRLRRGRTTAEPPPVQAGSARGFVRRVQTFSARRSSLVHNATAVFASSSTRPIGTKP